MAPRPKCPTCGTSKWKKKSGTGTLICRYGHILQDYRNETSEATEFGPYAVRKRALKSNRSPKEKKSRANPILYHGDRARYHYFQCLQVLLRMQIKKLIELWNLPPEFEPICRDTWALHLSLLSFPPAPEPFLHSQELDNSQDVGQSGKGDAPGRKKAEQEPREGDVDVSESSDTEPSSPLDDDEDKDSTDSELDELLREASEIESSDSGGEEKDQPSQMKGISRKRPTRWRRDDSPAATISVLVHSCWFLRIPVIYKDFINLIETYTLPYLEPVRLLPLSLTRHLTKHAKQALSPHRAPSPVLLHTITSRLSRLCFERYGIFSPELNTAPILWRAVRHMGGTTSLYGVTKALARYLELPLTVNKGMATPLLRQTNKDPTSHLSDNAPPEVTLVAAVVIALKLIYGFGNGKQVTPMEGWDPAHTMPALEVYLEHLQGLDASDLRNSRRCFSLSSMCMNDVQEEDERCLDGYLDFCERALLGRDSEAANNVLASEYFPLQKSMEADERIGSEPNVSAYEDGDRNGDAGTVLPATRIAGGELERDESAVRAGAMYTIYRAEDVFGIVPDKYAIVLSRAARWTGVSGNDLSWVIERFERRLARRWKRSKSRCKMKEESEN